MEKEELEVLIEIRDFFRRHKQEIAKELGESDNALREALKDVKDTSYYSITELKRQIVEQSEAFKDIINEDLAFRIGEEIAKLHSADIVHGDITTSNIMLQDDKLVFIDFGLGRYSPLDEDKAVDLLVLKKSLQSIDYNLAVKYFDCVLKGYGRRDMVNKISDIESRGRYTH